MRVKRQAHLEMEKMEKLESLMFLKILSATICLGWPLIFVLFILLEHKQGFLFIFLVLFSVSNLGVVNSRLNSRDPGRRHKIIVSRWSQQGISRSVERQNNADFILKLLPDKGLLEKLHHSILRLIAVNRGWMWKTVRMICGGCRRDNIPWYTATI